MDPIITAIIPTYRRPHHLKAAIESIRAQTFPSYKVCIYDNAADPITRKIVSHYADMDPRIRYFAHSENIGSTRNFEFGLSQVATPFFTFLSDDDLLLPHFFSIAMEAMDKTPDAGIFMGGLIYADEKLRIKGFTLDDWNEGGVCHPEQFLTQFLSGRQIPLWTSMVFSTKVRDQIGGLKTELEVPDIDFIVRAAGLFPTIFDRTPCAIFRQHGFSISSSLKIKTVFDTMEEILREIVKNSSSISHFSIYEEKFRREVCRIIKVYLMQAALRGDRSEIISGEKILKDHLNDKLTYLETFLINISKKASQVMGIMRTLMTVRKIMKRGITQSALKRKIAKTEFKQIETLLRRSRLHEQR